MDRLELTIETAPGGIEAVAARLTALGYDSFIIDDQEDFQRFLAEERAYWDLVDEELVKRMEGLSQIRLYLEAGPEGTKEAQALAAALQAMKKALPEMDLGSLCVKTALCRDEDWANTWKQYYQPIAVGEELLIVPQWLRSEDPGGRIPIFLDPGMIFGTGAHASTQMCLEALEEEVHGGEKVIDLGSGSGILSIAALLLGAGSALCVDVDPLAEDVARSNAALNGLRDDRFQAVTGNVLEDRALMDRLAARRCGLLLANIVAATIVALAPEVLKLLEPGGRFLCSGILASREAEVVSALEGAGLRVTGRRCQEDWVQLCCTAAR